MSHLSIDFHPLISIPIQDDLPNKVVSSHEIATYAKENGYFQWVFISVKENKNIAEAMQYVILSPSHICLQVTQYL